MKGGYAVLEEGYHRDLLCGGFLGLLHPVSELTIVTSDKAFPSGVYRID